MEEYKYGEFTSNSRRHKSEINIFCMFHLIINP